MMNLHRMNILLSMIGPDCLSVYKTDEKIVQQSFLHKHNNSKTLLKEFLGYINDANAIPPANENTLKQKSFPNSWITKVP